MSSFSSTSETSFLQAGINQDTIRINRQSIFLEAKESFDSSLFKSGSYTCTIPKDFFASSNSDVASNLRDEEIKNEESKSLSSINTSQDESLDDARADKNIKNACKFVDSIELSSEHNYTFSSEIEGKVDDKEESKSLLSANDTLNRNSLYLFKNENDINKCLQFYNNCILKYPMFEAVLWVMKARALLRFNKTREAQKFCNKVMGKAASFELIYQLIYFNLPSNKELSFGLRNYSIMRWRFCSICDYQFNYLNHTQYLCLLCKKYQCEGCHNRESSESEICDHNFTYMIKPRHDLSQGNLKIGIWENFSHEIMRNSKKLSGILPFEPENQCIVCDSETSNIWYQCSCCPEVSFCADCQLKNEYFQHERFHLMIKMKIPFEKIDLR